jgi:hypothetical protein
MNWEGCVIDRKAVALFVLLSPNFPDGAAGNNEIGESNPSEGRYLNSEPRR